MIINDNEPGRNGQNIKVSVSMETDVKHGGEEQCPVFNPVSFFLF